MYTLLHHVRSKEGLLVEAPALLLALAAAESFYKFHSFTLECVCFLGTWLAFSSLLALAFRRPSALSRSE